MGSRKYKERGVPVPLAQCLNCKDHLPKRVTYLYEEEQQGYLCKTCWHSKYDGVDFSNGFLVEL